MCCKVEDRDAPLLLLFCDMAFIGDGDDVVFGSVADSFLGGGSVDSASLHWPRLGLPCSIDLPDRKATATQASGETPPFQNPVWYWLEELGSCGGRGMLSLVQWWAASKSGVRLQIIVESRKRKIADKVALSGYFVVVSDFLHGDPYQPGNPNNPGMWLQSHNPQEAFKEAKPIIAAPKEKGISTIGAAGYCQGAKMVVELAKVHEIQAAVLLHPSLIAVDDIKEINCPISILGAEIDKSSPPKLLNQSDQVLSANSGVGHCVKISPG